MRLSLLILVIVFFITSCSENESSTLENPETKSAKTKNYFTNSSGKDAFSKHFSHLSNEEIDIFFLGKSVFKTPWVTAPSITTARDGLGPLFNANTCRNCHPNNGAGVAVKANGKANFSLLIRLSHKESNNNELIKKVGFEPDSTYGAQLSVNGTINTPAEGQFDVKYNSIKAKYLDGTSYELRSPTYHLKNLKYGALDKETVYVPRIGSALIGLGLIEHISDKDILAHEDIADVNKDGISGKANYGFDPESNTTRLGKFTWKASATSVKHQSAGAAHNDMGLSNPLFPLHNCTKVQENCLKEAKLSEHELDLPAYRLDAVTFYLSNLAIPKQREVGKHKKGKELFTRLNCATCHVPSFNTSDGINIKPYSDFLVHDMGEALADGRSEFLASGKEWRTAPLWGMGLYKKVSGEANFLHDGRARSIEEAILWHGGEAEKSKNDFMTLNKKSRTELLDFLNSI